MVKWSCSFEISVKNRVQIPKSCQHGLPLTHTVYKLKLGQKPKLYCPLKFPKIGTYANVMTVKSSQFHGSRRKVKSSKQKPLAIIFISDSKVYIPVKVYLRTSKPRIIKDIVAFPQSTPVS